MKRSKYVLTVLLIVFANLRAHDAPACDSTLVIAHRGASNQAPENTLSAFQLAIDVGADFIEMDIRMSSDDSLMVIHDATVDATTDGTGLVSSKTFAELRSLDAGSWFSPAFIGEQIPTLYEALSLAKTHGVKACVELKQSGIHPQALGVIQDLNMVEDVIVFSFDFSELQTIKMMLPSIKVCFLDNSISQTEITNLAGINGEYVGCGDIPTIEEVEFGRNLNVEFFAWTVNDPDDMQKLMSKGVAGIITDDPHEVKGLKTYMGIGNGGLMAYWDFDEGSGGQLYDGSGNGNDAMASGVSWASGFVGLGGVFNGVSSFASIPLSPSLDISGPAVSISAWLNLDVLPSGISTAFGPVFDSDEDAYILYLDQANSELRFKVTDDDGDTERPGISESLLFTGSWIHVVGVYNGDEAMIYLNGELADYHVNTSLDNLQTGQVPQFGQNGGNFFDGTIDEFKIYNRALSRAEVMQMYQSLSLECSAVTNDIVHLPDLGLPIAEDTTVCDSTLLSFQVDEIPRLSFVFDGVVDYVNLNSVVPDISGGSHSFFGWFKTLNPTGDERIFSINGSPFSNSNVCLFGIYNGYLDVYNGSYHSGSTLVNDGNWHFLGYTWNQPTQQLQLWVDGVLDGNFTADLSVSSTDLASLGQEFDGLEVGNLFSGSMAELMIWKTAIAGPEIAQIMLNPVLSSDPDFPNLVGYYNRTSACGWELRDKSSFANHGISCGMIAYEYVLIPSFNSSDFALSWTSDIGGFLSGTNQVDFYASGGNQNLLFTADNGNGMMYADTIAIDVNGCTGLNSPLSRNNLNIYPNPTEGLVFIQDDKMEGGKLIISSASGSCIAEVNLSPGQEVAFDLSEFSPGMYLLSYNSLNSNWFSKLILK